MRMRIMFVALLTLATMFAIDACGDSKEKEDPASFTGAIDGQPVSHENDEAVPNQFSAVINDRTIVIYLMTSPTAIIHIVGETNDGHSLPGNLKINELTYTDGANLYIYQSGTVSLDECPSTIGDIFTGKLTDVKVKNEATNVTKTINGEFSVTVVNVAAPALVCGGSEETPDEQTAPECGYSADQCEDGVCCPYVECFNACFIKDCMTTCADPNKMTECLSCMGACDSNCQPQMTSACETAFNALNTCMDNHGCDNLVDDAEIACARTYCCNELKAAFQK